MKMRLPDGMASVSVDSKTYEPDENGEIVVENHEHVAALMSLGAVDPTNIANPVVAMASLSPEDAVRLQEAFVPVDEKKQLEDLSAALEAANTELAAAGEKVAQLEADLAAAGKQIETLGAAAKEAEDKVKDLESKLADAQKSATKAK